MRRGTILAAVVIAYLGVVGPALAAPPDGAAGPWADYVVSANQGIANPVGGFLPNRSDPSAALGPAESPPGDEVVIPTGSFYSMGFGGSLTLGFENPICNQPGVDLAIEVREITKLPYPVERAQVYVSEDGVTFLLAGTVSRDDTVAMPAGITVANFVRLVDVNALADYAFDPNADGFDVDGVRALNTTCPTGKIEICKAASNGNTNRPYQFTLNGGAPFTVRGGRCSGPITTRPGLNTVVELQSVPPTDVSAISVRPSNRVISQDLPNRTAVVKVITGSTAASETKVTFTNQPAGGTTGDLKICKVSESPQYWGRQFSFRVNNGPLFSTEANPAFDPPGSWTCRLAGTFAVGSKVTVKEEIPAGAEVAFIDSDPADRLVDFDTNAGTATVTIGSGATIVLYDNEPIPPAQAGYIEVCKDAELIAYAEGPTDGGRLPMRYEPDPYVKGPFTFTISPPDGSSFDVEVGVGQCTAPLLVAAGVVRVTEHAKANHTLVDVYTIPEDRLLASNLINRTADVEVPVSPNVNDESQVHFVNRRDRGQLKICKALGPGSEALSGMRFEFWIAQLGDASLMNSVANWTEITALAGSTQCRIVGDYPVGNQVTVDESDPGEYVDVAGEVTAANPLTIAPGINTVTITNTAVGLLEICKAAVPDLRVQPTFRFRVNNGGIISIRAGTCKPPMRVAVGEYTIVEMAEMNYELDPNAPGGGIVVTPPGQEVSKNLALRTVRVRVDYGAGGETRVDFYNRIKRGQVKICKQVSPGSMDALGMTNFTYTYFANGEQSTAVGQSIRHGECVLITDPRTGGPREFPILQPGGQPTTVTIDEDQATFGSGIVVAFTYQGSGGTDGGNPCSGTITIDPLGAGMNHVTFINSKDNFSCVGD